MAFESEKSFPFDSILVNGVHDRRYIADDFARYFRTFISSGMFMKEPDNLQIIANGDMTVTLRPGKIIIDGYRYDNIADIIIPITPADGVLNRIDRVSLTWDKNTRDIHMEKREGIPSYDPIPPECRRNAEYLDYVTADIHIKAGVISITQADIEDQRLNTAVCGLAVAFSNIDTRTLYAQVQTDLVNFRTETQKEILQWLDTLQESLDENAMVNLQNQITNLRNQQSATDIGRLRTTEFATLKDFVVATNIENLIPQMFRFKDTGGWGPMKQTGMWYRCIILYQNPYQTGNTHTVGGNGIFLTDSNLMYLGYITGQKDSNNLQISYKSLGGEISILDSGEAIKANTTGGRAAGALGVKQLYTALNDSLAGGKVKFSVESDGVYVTYNAGADTVQKKLGSGASELEVVNSAYFRATTNVTNLSTSLVVPSGTTFGILAITVNAYFRGNSEITGNGVKKILSRSTRESTSGTFYDNGIEFVLCEFNAGGTINISSTMTASSYSPGIVAAIVRLA